MDQKAKDLGDLGDSMSEEEAKSDLVDVTSDDEPKGHVGELESIGEGGSKKDTSMVVFAEELKGGVVEMVQNLVKEEELVCESKPNVNEVMKAEPGVEKKNEDLVEDEKIEGGWSCHCSQRKHIFYCNCIKDKLLLDKSSTIHTIKFISKIPATQNSHQLRGLVI